MTFDSSFPKPTHALDHTALLEVGCEELPAALLPGIREALFAGAQKLRKEFRLGEGDIRVYATPQRLIVFFLDLPDSQEARVERVMGPPSRLAGTLPDQPSPQATGFAKNQSVPVSSLFFLDTPKGSYLAVDRSLPVQSAKDVLPELFSRLVGELPLSRSMRWGEGSGPFLRPILWTLALFGEELIPFSVCGQMSGNKTRTPRSMGFLETTVHHVSHYASLVSDWPLIVDTDLKKKMISQEIDTTVRMEADSGLLPHGAVWVSDPELLSEVSDLVEQFRVVVGAFSTEFLNLPQELIQTVLRVHQRYFVLKDKEGQTLPNFVCVAGNPRANLHIIRSGYEKVVRARLEDAQYYFDRDRKRSLSDFSSDLSGLNLFPGSGTYLDHARATRDVADWFLDHVPDKEGLSRTDLSGMLGRISAVYKADLATGLVREFPELQGVIGGHYWRWENREQISRQDAESGKVLLEARAIAEHYRPRFSGDVLPESLLGRILAASDKYLYQVAAFKAGLSPSGSEDPYAVRRAGTGLVALIADSGWSISVKDLASRSAGIFGESDCSLPLLNFLLERLENLLGKDAPILLVRAALVSPSEPIVLSCRRLAFQKSILSDPSLPALANLYSRISNIIEKTGEKIQKFNPELLVESAEKLLWDQMKSTGLASQDGWGALCESGDFSQIWKRSLLLVDPVTNFFESVLVNAPSKPLRDNRLALLGTILSGLEMMGKLSFLTQLLLPLQEGAGETKSG